MFRLTIITQVYPPDPAAVGQHIADVAEEMVCRGFAVTVLTSARGYDDPSQRYAKREVRGGVEVRRFPLSSFGKRSLAVRLAAQGLFMLQAMAAVCVGRRPDVILASTSPPFAGFGAGVVAWLRRAPLVWWVMDLNPDQLIATGRIRSTALIARVFDAMNRFTIGRSASIIALDRFMATRLDGKRGCAAKMAVIPPWAPDDHSLSSKGTLAFRARHGFEGRFVVMHSGNHAVVHPLETLLDAAEKMANDPRFVFAFIGGGAGKAVVEKRIRSGARNVVSLPYQPLETLGDSLHAADLHVVSMGDAMVGIVHPCKIYGALAVGKPILLLGPRNSAAGDIVAGSELGWIVSHGDAAGAEKAIQAAAALGPGERSRMAERIQAAFTADFGFGIARAKVADVLQDAAIASHR